MPRILLYFDEFAAQQKCPHLVNNDGSVLFANGAKSADEYGFDHAAPPTDKFDRLTLCKMYHQIKAQRIEVAFRDLQKALLSEHLRWTWDEDEFGPPPSEKTKSTGLPCPVAALKRLAQLAGNHHANMSAIDQEIAEIPEIKKQRQAAADRALAQHEAANKRQAELQEIMSITL